MKEEIKKILYTSILTIFIIFLATYLWHRYTPTVSGPAYTEEEVQIGSIPGNKKVASFREAKSKLTKIYKGIEQSFYCGCSYRRTIVLRNTCSFRPQEETRRAHQIEWEHVVPAHRLGGHLKSWKKGHPSCLSKKGQSYRGRQCARKRSEHFRFMEADLYNLVPAIGEVNRARSNYHVGKVRKHSESYEGCNTKIAGEKIEPRDKVKGFMARIYLYMNAAYPQSKIFSPENKKLLKTWDRDFPPSKAEITRAERIEKIQGNSNPFVLEWQERHRPKKIHQEQEQVPGRQGP